MKRIICLLAFILTAVAFTGCKKGDSDTEQDNNPKNKTVLFYLKQDCNVGNVTVTCNDVSKVIKDYSSSDYFVSCDDTDYAIFDLKPGKYHYSAIGTGNLKWENDFEISENQDGCKYYQLTCDGVVPQIKGYTGPLRFNMVHSNNGVDFNLYVQAPDGTELSVYNRKGAGGNMDIVSNCLIGNDASPTTASVTYENLFFGTPQRGTYKIWVVYGGYCTTTPPASGSYSIKIANGLDVVQTLSGTLTSGKSTVYTYTY